MPAYNLSVFYNPQELLALFKHEFLKNKNVTDEVGCVENLVFQSEMTSRDKDHVCHIINSYFHSKNSSELLE